MSDNALDFDFSNLLKSFGLNDDETEKVQEMIDRTIDLNLGMKADDIPVHRNARER